MTPEARAAYFEAGRAAGRTEEEIEAAISEADRVDAYLDACRCPQCAAVLGRRKDPRQAGPTSVPGVWFNYVCSCGYHCDRVEPEVDLSS